MRKSKTTEQSLAKGTVNQRLLKIDYNYLNHSENGLYFRNPVFTVFLKKDFLKHNPKYLGLITS